MLERDSGNTFDRSSPDSPLRPNPMQLKILQEPPFPGEADSPAQRLLAMQARDDNL